MEIDTKTMIIGVATSLFQKKGYKGTGLNEILRECNITKGALYHHFPNGKEELLIACLHSMNETITREMDKVFQKYPSVLTAVQAMIDILIEQFEREGTIKGYTFSSIVYEMASLSEPVRNASAASFLKIQMIFSKKLTENGYSKEAADSIALMLIAAVEGGIMLCLTHKTSEPLKTISQGLANLLKTF